MTQSYTLITGASSGIGGAIAEKLSQTQNLILHGRDRAKLEAVLKRCAPGDHRIWEYDLARIDTLQDDFEHFVIEAGVSIDRFLYAAGVSPVSPIRAIDVTAVRRTLDINTNAAILLTASLMKGRIAGKTLRSIVFISSVSGLSCGRGMSLYGMSKGALDAFVRASTAELGEKGVRINSVCPAAVQTEMSAEILADETRANALAQRHPLGIGTPQDIVGAVVFLLSDQARWITGQNVVIDGGALRAF